MGQVMQENGSQIGRRGSARVADRRQRIRADLENKGVSPGFSEPLAQRLERLRSEPGSETYAAALEGAAAAYDAYRGDAELLDDRSSDIEEIQRLMQGFAGELLKLEEGLRTISAYVLRMHSRASRDGGGVLH
jgi:hypothetical protein